MVGADPTGREGKDGEGAPAAPAPWTLGDLWRWGSGILAAAGVAEGRFEAEVLLRRAANLSRAAFLSRLEEGVAAEAVAVYEARIERRSQREPLAYLLGEREFYGLTMTVDRRVLVPRPESEALVELALAVARTVRRRDASPVRIADIGTGSGAIAIALATHLPDVLVFAVDHEPGALEVAGLNGQRHGVAGRIRLLAGDLMDPLPGTVDLAVANLPYIPTARLALLEPEVARWEPRAALDGGPDGLDAVRALLRQAPVKVERPGHLLLEADPEQMGAIAAFGREVLAPVQVTVERDLAGRERVIHFDLVA